MSGVKASERINQDETQMSLKVKGQDGSFVQFQVTKTTVLKKLMEAYCMRQGLEVNRICFCL